MTLDVKHFEDCEQLFLTIGKCFTVLALINFFNMNNRDDSPNKNRPPFIDEFLLLPTPDLVDDEDDQFSSHDDDFVKNYSLCLRKYYFIFLDLKDAVKEGNGARLATLHKELPFYISNQ